MIKPKRQHEFVIRVSFDKPVSAKRGLEQVKDTIHGNFYPTAYMEWEDPEEFWVKSFKHLRKS